MVSKLIQVRIYSYLVSEKPKVVTNCSHLTNVGRKLEASKILLLFDRGHTIFHHFYMENINKTENLKTAWIEGLAIEEMNMDETGIIDIHDHLNPVHLLEESSIQFMNTLRDLVEVFTLKFNQYRGEQTNSHIKIFKISNTVNDFMLFRNSLRLVFARKANDLITIGFLANGKDLFSARLNQDDPMGQGHIHELKAHLGPFNKITWRFQGEIVEIDALVRHYLSEFIKQSAR